KAPFRSETARTQSPLDADGGFWHLLPFHSVPLPAAGPRNALTTPHVHSSPGLPSPPPIERRGTSMNARPSPVALYALLLGLAAGCGTTRMTDSTRTATEQLLISNAVDRSVSQFDFTGLAGKKVYFDAQYLDGTVDKGYVVSSLRQHLLASGCLLQEDRKQATYVVEARSGGVGTDHSSLLVGVPQMTVPTLVPGQPSQIPEIPLAKKNDQNGVAKIAVFAYNRLTGERVWQ